MRAHDICSALCLGYIDVCWMLKSILQDVVPKRHRQVLIRQVMLPKKAGVGLQVAGASPGGGVEVAMEIVEFLAIINR